MYCVNEDDYWESRREALESPRNSEGDDAWIVKSDILCVDGEIENIEKEYGCAVEKLSEDELMELVERFQKILPISAAWSKRLDCITYFYEEVG